MPILHALAFFLGFLIASRVLLSAVRTFVLPRPGVDAIVQIASRLLRIAFNLAMRLAPNYRRRDEIMALYGPVGLIFLVPILLSMLGIGFMLMFWGIGAGNFYQAFTLSGSSLLTLGFVTANKTTEYGLAFLEAVSGTFILALLISYLPTIYSMFSKRELLVTTLEVSAGSPPWAVTFVDRSFLIRQFDQNDLDRTWREWNAWFNELEESHTSLPALPFFRSQQPNRSWITAAGTVLDAAALVRSSVDIPMNPRADLMIRSGYLALKSIAMSYGFRYDPQPAFPRVPISISREEFDRAHAQLTAAGVPMKADVERCWIHYAGWRVNYDAQLLDLCAVVMAPEAPWSSDRCHGRWALTPRFKDRNIDPTSIASVEANSKDALPDTVTANDDEP